MTYRTPIRAIALASLAAITGLVAAQVGCAKAQPMRSSDSVPASEGTVRATAGDNGNTNVSVRVAHLASPSRVASDATIYVVWIQPRGGAMQNVGALEVNDNLEGQLDLVTPHERFQLIVTPEANAQVAYPEHERVFSSDVNRAG